MKITCPNLSEVAGYLIGAKLISIAGSLKNLVMMPASTVQLLGAEKALFRHMTNKKSRPPKHGIIFQHPTIHNAPYWQRGKLARALAGKIAIAVKTDLQLDKFIAEELEEHLQ